jgi:hypothetical protein
MHEDLWRKTFKNPFMLKSLERGHSIYWIPIEASFHKAEEVVV